MTMNSSPMMKPVATTSGTETRWNCGTPGELNNTSAPTMNDVTPATVSAPCVGALISRMNNTKAVTRKRMPNQLTDNKPMPYSATVTHTTPMKPATQPPGLEISIRIAMVPTDSSEKTIFGLVRNNNNCSMKLITSDSVRALVV